MAIAPQTVEKNVEIRDRHRLAFPILHDGGNAYARRLGLVFQLPDDLRAIYEQFGIDLPAFNGDDSWELPIPARIVVSVDGQVRQIDADPDYTHRPEPEATLEALRALG